jgi:hypothetical protein
VCAETVLCYSFHKQGRILLRGFSRFARMSYSHQIRHHQNLAKRRTSAIRAKLKAESSKRFGSCKAIFSTSMASLIDGDKVAERGAEVVNSSSSTLMLLSFAKLDREEAELSSFSRTAKIAPLRRAMRAEAFFPPPPPPPPPETSFPSLARVGELTYSPSKSGIASQINSGHAYRGEQFSPSWRKSAS